MASQNYDLTTCNLLLWKWAKGKVCWSKPRTSEELVQHIRDTIAAISLYFLRTGVDSVPFSL
jgi:hypothetical protein